ncbi:MAG: ferredoxin [Actinobacteria bacterium]|nr:MAG: ferredoxin [Actinomycetota bacterium]
MRIVFDKEACTGHGRCYTLAAELFEGDDDGYCIDPTGEVPEGLEAAARRGAGNCPERAILVVEDSDSSVTFRGRGRPQD